MLYISVFCKHIETCLNIGYNLVLSAKQSSESAVSQYLTADFVLYTSKNAHKLWQKP